MVSRVTPWSLAAYNNNLYLTGAGVDVELGQRKAVSDGQQGHPVVLGSLE